MLKKQIKFLHKKKILLLFPLIFTLPLINALLLKDINLLDEKQNFQLLSYSDTSTSEGDGDNGNSVVTELKRIDGKVHFTYCLGSKFPDKYAGFIIDIKNAIGHLDFSKHDDLIITMDPCNSNALQPIFMTHVDGFTREESSMTNRYSLYDVDLIKGQNRYKIRLKDIKTPMWWHEFNKTTETKLGKDDFSKVTYMKIENGTISPVNIPQSLIIESIVISKNRLKIALTTLLAIVLYFLVYWTWLSILKKIKTPVIIPYEKLTFINHGDRDLNAVVEVIAKDYNKSELSINDIVEKTGLTPIKISTLLQDKFDTPFKLYLNSIRVAEAKRLLKESDRQISEISYMVGYKNPTHFNRIFKQLNQMTPKQYRLAHRS